MARGLATRRARRLLGRLVVVGALVALTHCGSRSPPASCPQLDCKIPCDSAGTAKDDRTGCATCLCVHAAPLDAGTACPALACDGTCGLGQAKDPLTGCETCACCFPADCMPGGCNGTGADGCPTCGPCH